MKKYLITGFSGFVAKHFLDFLEKVELNPTVLGLDLQEPYFDLHQYTNVRCHYQKINLLDGYGLEKILEEFKPDYIVHLASFSSVARSWEMPIESFNNNTNIFMSLIETLRKLSLTPRVLSIGSSEEYGCVVERDLPLTEDSPLNPISPYAVARVAQELMSKVYVKAFDMDIILTRSFNHFGPGQKENFAIASFAKRLVMEKIKGNERCRLETGDITVIRDFLDVRDVSNAYYLLLKNGRPGEVYNVCSGRGFTLEGIISEMSRKLNLKVDLSINKELLRPNDNRIIIGSNHKIQQELGWTLQFDLDHSLNDILKYWEYKLSGSIST